VSWSKRNTTHHQILAFIGITSGNISYSRRSFTMLKLCVQYTLGMVLLFVTVHAHVDVCVGKYMRIRKENEICGLLYEATDFGLEKLNAMVNTEAPLEPIQILKAHEKPVAGPYQAHLIELQLQVAPMNNCSNEEKKNHDVEQT